MVWLWVDNYTSVKLTSLSFQKQGHGQLKRPPFQTIENMCMLTHRPEESIHMHAHARKYTHMDGCQCNQIQQMFSDLTVRVNGS